jgi:hypothetical protein
MFHGPILTALWPLALSLVATVPNRRPVPPDAIHPRPPPLPLRYETSDQFDGINAEDSHMFLVIGVEVWNVVRSSNLHEHADNYAEEATEFWHSNILPAVGD